MKRTMFWWMAGAAVVGFLSTFWQIIEKLALLKNTNTVLSCNFNDTFNCANVLNAPQASVFGPPNALIGIIMFTFFLTVAIMMLAGGKLVGRLAIIVQGLALFMLGFTLWFMFQTTYRIQSVCIFCIFIGTAVLVINAVMLRHNFGDRIKRWTAKGADLFGWSLIWLAVAIAMAVKFA